MGSIPDSEQWHHSDESEADVASVPDESDRIDSALLSIRQLTERVQELEARAADQKMSLGDTIVRLRRRVRILEKGTDTSANATSSREEGGKHYYVTYPALDGRNYVTYAALDARDYLPRIDLPAPPPLTRPCPSVSPGGSSNLR